MDDTTRLPLPMEPLECRQRAEAAKNSPSVASLFALLAIAGELHEIKKLLRKR